MFPPKVLGSVGEGEEYRYLKPKTSPACYYALLAFFIGIKRL